MNTDRIGRNFPGSRISLRLWLNMMLLVILSVAFIWVIQIFFLERNFIDATTAEIEKKLEPVLRELETGQKPVDEAMLLVLSKAVNGKTIVLDGKGEILHLYSGGHVLGDDSVASVKTMLAYVSQSDEFKGLERGVSFHRVLRYGSDPFALEIGIPISYEGASASVLLYQTLDQLHMVLMINRNQLISLTILLTLIAALIAALLALRFVKPIGILKDTVDRLARGELEATPGLKLKDELGQLSDSVDELGRALRRVDVLRKEVIANVSHELRSPLALIAGYAEMVRDISWSEAERREEDLNLIIGEANRMGEMVNDILDYSQLQAGYIQLKRDWYDLYEIIELERDRSQSGAAKFGITLEYDGSDNIPVFADAVKMCQVLRNLLNNAVNHTENDKTITIRVREEGPRIRLSVINPGVPIPEEDRGIIWEKYQRSQHQGRRNNGTGIGLSIVKTYLDAHGMAYGVDCAEGLTAFWFEYVRDGRALS